MKGLIIASSVQKEPAEERKVIRSGVEGDRRFGRWHTGSSTRTAHRDLSDLVDQGTKNGPSGSMQGGSKADSRKGKME